MEFAVAAITAGLLTLFDLDRTFYVPSQGQGKLALFAWEWGFIVANGIIAGALYLALRGTQNLPTSNPWFNAFLIGLAYLAIIRAKFTTFTYQGKDIPAGTELAYEAAKEFFYKRINRIAKAARFAETIDMADRNNLAELISRVKLGIEQDALLTPESRVADKAWTLRVAQDQHASDPDKKAALADYLLSGHRSSDYN